MVLYRGESNQNQVFLLQVIFLLLYKLLLIQPDVRYI